MICAYLTILQEALGMKGAMFRPTVVNGTD